MKTIIAGSRDGFHYSDVVRAIQNCKFPITEVVSGTARGPDSFGEAWAKENKIPIKRFKPDWNTHKLKAGYLRNEEMAKYSEALIALWDNKSKGTKHMIQTANKLGLKVFVVSKDVE